ncbi:hypothetical protein M514_06741 [Trichuris suis]|uniref:Uncharacterized protein n=1 Tax=Trichuris suis TaxID=68888 RepID=A0A085M564_9BILA|nr:hypothetical protein M513_06741 [Trichuris suis]KFD69947.1 hypothetical protein M514_06741 [Trichuris suis]
MVFNHVSQISDHTTYGGKHVRRQQALDDPECVPVVEFAETTAGYYERIWNVEQRKELLVVSHLLSYLPTKFLPHAIERLGPSSQLVVFYCIKGSWRGTPILWKAHLQLGARRIKMSFNKLM